MKPIAGQRETMAHTELIAEEAAALLSPRAFRHLTVGILLVAAIWRLVMVALMPCIARDSVTFCWYARDLGEQGPSYLAAAAKQQGPLLPTLLLGAQRLACGLGAPDAPLTWQRTGQALSFVIGLVVVALTGALTMRFVRRLALPVDDRLAGCSAMLLAALLPLNVWLSTEVMSDELHLALYLVGAAALLRLDSVKAALTCGLAAGLAFLARPEGAMIALAGVIVLAADHAAPWRVRAGRTVALCAAFLACAVPFWALAGTLSPKKNPLDWLRGDEAALGSVEVDRLHVADADVRDDAPGPLTRIAALACGTDARVGRPALAKVWPLDLGWYALVPYALYKLFVAGRVVVPLLALLPLINLRRRLLRPPMLGVSVCVAGHLAATVALLHKSHYLDNRHMLVPVMLLVPPAATLLARLAHLARRHVSRTAAVGLVCVLVLPLAAYSLRVPNHDDRFLADAARWLIRHDPDVRGKRLLCGGSPKRIAFYADMRWEPWYEHPEEYAGLCNQIRQAKPGYFAIILEPAGRDRKRGETTGNRALVAKLLDDPSVASRLSLVHFETGPGDPPAELHIYELLPG